MNAIGREHLKRKLRACDTLSELARVWGNIGVEYQRADDVQATKDERKSQLGGVTA